jgi:hypothetical protein
MPPIITASRPIALLAGAADLDVAPASHEERPAEDLGAGLFINRRGLAGQHGFVNHHPFGFDQRPVGGNSVAGLDSCDIARNQLRARQMNEPSLAHHPDHRRGHFLQPRERRFGFTLLIDS